MPPGAQTQTAAAWAGAAAVSAARPHLLIIDLLLLLHTPPATACYWLAKGRRTSDTVKASHIQHRNQCAQPSCHPAYFVILLVIRQVLLHTGAATCAAFEPRVQGLGNSKPSFCCTKGCRAYMQAAARHGAAGVPLQAATPHLEQRCRGGRLLALLALLALQTYKVGACRAQRSPAASLPA